MNIQSDQQPWVTFCMSTYKRPGFLKDQLSGILRQEFSNFAIIVSDNDVEASAKVIVESFGDPRIEYYNNGANLGMVKSFNRSLERARSEYVVMITDDDPVYPDMLKTLYDLTLQYPDYGMYMSGCNLMFLNPEVADSFRAKVGINSCLVSRPVGAVRTFSGRDFPYAYFKGETGHLLWSTGIVKREIALAVGGMPDFGAPYNTDFGYIVLCGARAGVVLINKALGHQVIHGANYGYTESDFEKFYVTPNGFYSWVMQRLPEEHDYAGLDKLIKTFLGRWVVSYALSIKTYARQKNIAYQNFDQFTRKLFKIPYLRKWKYKYLLAAQFPNLFEVLIYLKSKFFTSK